MKMQPTEYEEDTIHKELWQSYIKQVRSRLFVIWKTTKYGWDSTAWFFLLLGSTAIITQVVGLAGTAAAIFTILIFYYIGKAHYHLERASEN